jgi:Kef-type K+ transport system membrane component KefB
MALVVCFGLSFVASYLGLAAIIGAFLAGMIFSEFKDLWPCEEKFEPLNEFLVPFFFIFVGVSVNLSSFGSVIWIALAITVLAIITKFIGCGAGAWKMGKQSASIIGLGMIPRGEVGIIIASIGLGMAVVSEGIFAGVIFMSMATTIVAPPLVARAFKRKHSRSSATKPRTID